MSLSVDETRLPVRDGTRRRILEAAISCFARAGFHGTSMQEICAKAEISPGGLYRHFSSKDKIIEAIAESERERIAEMMVGMSGPGPILPAMLQCGMSHLREFCGTERSALCSEIEAEAQRNDKVRLIFDRVEQDVYQRLRDALTLAQSRGEFDGSLDIDLTTTLFMAIHDGLLKRMTFDQSMTPDRIEPFLNQMVMRMLGLSRQLPAEAAGVAPPAAISFEVQS